VVGGGDQLVEYKRIGSAMASAGSGELRRFLALCLLPGEILIVATFFLFNSQDLMKGLFQ
jgi:hypothetical protein